MMVIPFSCPLKMVFFKLFDLYQAVHVRGLDEASLNDASKKHWLSEWIELSSKVSGNFCQFVNLNNFLEEQF